MARLHFNQVFFGLMALSFVSAFLAPPRFTDAAKVQIEGLFIPISRPAYRVSNWLRGRVAPPATTDPRPDEDVRGENRELRQRVAYLTAELERLQSLAAERQSLGRLTDMCDRFNVEGADSGIGQGLILGGMLLGSVRADQAVLSNNFLVGKIYNAGPMTAHVRLVTDPGFRIGGNFSRPGGGEGVQRQLAQLSPIVQGAGEGQMIIVNISANDADKHLHLKDWVTVADSRFASISGLEIGRIVSITRAKRSPLMAEIRVEPELSLTQLNDVWVMTRPH